ncbi:PREDICTED: protein shisa-5-like [Atta cephalotes]|uniref:Protein shisa-5-like n=1 Tax=Atta cephalotes TaxID=12957 RepID=A0A158NI76_ATTCE|nr:PREDICTED: protein shisa-5-like [Atta cephalotes]
MSRLEVALLLICLHTGYVYGFLDCNFEIMERNIFDHWATTCPRIFESKENNYCCVDVENKRSYCCPLLEFVQTTGVSLILPLAIAGIVIVFLLACCISCFCCSCCPWYRRNQGITYGNIQTPVVQVIQSPANVPPSYTSQSTQNIPPSYTSQPTQNIPTNYTSQPAQNYVPPYPTDSTAMPQPPPYTDEAYAKQAPYNPAYLPPQ